MHDVNSFKIDPYGVRKIVVPHLRSFNLFIVYIFDQTQCIVSTLHFKLQAFFCIDGDVDGMVMAMVRQFLGVA